MNFKRILWMTALLYVVSFIFGAVLAKVRGLDIVNGDTPDPTHWLISIAFFVIIIALFALWYFKKVTPSAKEGLLFGLVVIGISFVFDFAVIIPSILFSEATVEVLAYYLDPFFWLTIFAMVATPAVVGKLKSR